MMCANNHQLLRDDTYEETTCCIVVAAWLCPALAYGEVVICEALPTLPIPTMPFSSGGLDFESIGCEQRDLQCRFNGFKQRFARAQVVRIGRGTTEIITVNKSNRELFDLTSIDVGHLDAAGATLFTISE